MDNVEILKTISDKFYTAIEAIIGYYEAANEPENLRTDEDNGHLSQMATKLQELSDRAHTLFQKKD